MEKTILFGGIIVITAVSVLSHKEGKAQNEIINPVSKSLDKRVDTIPKSSGQNISKTDNATKRSRTRVTSDVDGQKKTVVLETTEENGRQIKAKLQGKSLAEHSINGEPIDSKEFKNYEHEVKSIIDEQRAQAIISNQEASRQISEKVPVESKNKQRMQQEKS